MSSIHIKIRRTDFVGLTLSLAVATSAAACSGSGAASASGDPAGSTSSTTAPAISVRPIATATTAPTPFATPTANVPAAVEIADPDLTMTLPVGWASYPLETYRFIIDSVVKTASPEEQAVLAAHLKDIDSGAVRMASGGLVAGASATLIIQVDTGDPSLEAAVERLGRLSKRFSDPASIEERPVTLSIGNAVRRVEIHPVLSGSTAAGIPSRTVEYIATLADGRTLWILATGPERATTFEALIDASVSSLRSR